MKQISIAIPTHDDRWQWWGQTVRNLHDDQRVAEIVVNDDGSPAYVRERIVEELKVFSKVKFSYNHCQQFVFRNKFITVDKCSSDIVALIDSDNIVDASYLDAFERYMFIGEQVVYMPDKSLPRFDYSKFDGHCIMKCSAKNYMDDNMGRVMFNTGNYIFSRLQWLSALRQLFDKEEKAPSCCDVIWTNYHLLKAGFILYVVKGMQYIHTDHPRSTYRMFVGKEPDATKTWQEKVRRL